MKPTNQSIEDLAEAILDGASVDWVVAESNGGDRGRLARHLRVVAAVSAASREAEPSAEQAAARSDLANPETWGHLRLIERIGCGAFGDVYRAWDTRLDREVALKLIPVDATLASRFPNPESREAVSEMLREGQLLARVRHPNVVTIHGADQIGGHVGIWMEFVRGRTLEELLHSKTFGPVEVARIGVELARALSAVHAAGLLHRDIKAQNVVRADDGRIVLMDFGTGRDLADEGSDLSGTPLYLAPELFQGQPATPQSDIYSLGVLLYHLLTRAYPVQGRTIREVSLAHGNKVRPDVRRARPDVPWRLAQVIERSIDPQPAARYSTAAVLCTALEKVASSRRWRWHAAAAAAILVVIATWLALGGDRPIKLPAGERTVLAVRLENRLNAPDGDDIVDGFTYELVRGLAALGGSGARLVVLSPDDGASPDDSKAFGGLLGASFVLDGTMSGSPESPHVDARLMGVADGVTHRTLSLDRDNLLGLRWEVLSRVAAAFELQFTVGRYQTTPIVYAQFLRGRALQARSGPDNTDDAAGIFWDASQQDSSFLPALAAWANAKLHRYRLGGTTMPPLDRKVAEVVREVHGRDEELAEAQSAMGWVHVLQHRDWNSARASFRKAIDLDPRLTTTYTDFFMSTLQPLGDADEALKVMTAARDENPMSLDVRRALATAQLDAGLYHEAIENLEWVRDQPVAARARNQQLPWVDMLLGRALYFAGRELEALKVFEGDPDGLWEYRGYVYARTGRGDEAEKLIAANPGRPARAMVVYAGLGDHERAVRALEAVARVHWLRAAAWLNKPEMRRVRDSGDARVAAFKKGLGLPP